MSSSPDHLPSKVSIPDFSVKSKFVFSLSSRDFVNTEKLLDGLEEAGNSAIASSIVSTFLSAASTALRARTFQSVSPLSSKPRIPRIYNTNIAAFPALYNNSEQLE